MPGDYGIKKVRDPTNSEKELREMIKNNIPDVTNDIKVEYTDDEVWFAHAVPYTYTDLQKQLKKLVDKPELSKILRHELLCTTINGVPCPLLTITEDVESYMSNEERFKLQHKLSSVLKKSFKQKY